MRHFVESLRAQGIAVDYVWLDDEGNSGSCDVMLLVEQRLADHLGDLQSFGWAVTRADALEALRHFIAHCLPQFGDYEDAMKTGEDFLFHSVLAPYINPGLLGAREVCQAALHAVEGFIRQILGWREYVSLITSSG